MLRSPICLLPRVVLQPLCARREGPELVLGQWAVHVAHRSPTPAVVTDCAWHRLRCGQFRQHGGAASWGSRLPRSTPGGGG